MARYIKLNGKKDIQDGTIESINVAAVRAVGHADGEYLGIDEAKLNLDYATAILYSGSLQISVDRTVADGVSISFPYILLRDTVNSKVYKLTTENGTLTTQEVV